MCIIFNICLIKIYEVVYMELYKKCRINPFDFAFLNVDSLEMRRNFNDEIVYSRKHEYEKMKKLDDVKDTNDE